MAAANNFPLQFTGNTKDAEEEEEEGEEEEPGNEGLSVFDAFPGTVREKVVLQRLVAVGRLPRGLADRTRVSDHYEKLHLDLSKEFSWDHMSGLLLVHPTCFLLVVESSRDVLLSVLTDLRELQLQGLLVERSKVVLMSHVPRSRMFQQWSHKVLESDPKSAAQDFEEEEGNTDSVVCSLLSALQSLSKHLDTSPDPPASLLDEKPELIIHQDLIRKLLVRDQLQSPQLFLSMYHSPVNVSVGPGELIRSNCLHTV